MNFLSRRSTNLGLFVALAIVPLSAIFAEPPKQVLLIGQGPDGHPEGTHEYNKGLRIIAACLSQVDGLSTQTVYADGAWKEGPNQLENADGAVLFLAEGARWIQEEPRRFEAFQKLAQRKGGLVVLHWAMGTREAEPIPRFVELFGGCHGGPDRKYAVVDSVLRPADPTHPIANGIRDFPVHDEFYYALKFQPGAEIVPVVTAEIDGQSWPVGWAWERPDGGRSFGFSGLHFHENWRHKTYGRLVTQGVAWSLGLGIPPSGIPLPDSELPESSE